MESCQVRVSRWGGGGGQRGLIMASLLVLEGPVVLGPTNRLLASDGPGDTVQRT